MAIWEDVSDEDVDISPDAELPPKDNLLFPFDPPKVEPLISLNALIGFFSPQTLKLIDYIKHRKFIILVENDGILNFIHCHLAHEFNCYICVVNNFQIMIANGGSMKCGGRCENMRL